MKSLEGAFPADPEVCVQACPPVKPFPGAKISWGAPAWRMPSIAAWLFLRMRSVGWFHKSDGKNFGMILGERVAYHVVRFVVDSEDNFWIGCKAARKLMPEFAELLGCGCCGVAAVTNYLNSSVCQKGAEIKIIVALTLPVFGCEDGSLFEETIVITHSIEKVE